MDANLLPRMKRKDYEDVSDDFEDLPLSSPATKIRRLDAEIPPMATVNAAAAFGQSPEKNCNNLGNWKIEELPNEERAIVLYSPKHNENIKITTPIVDLPSDFSISVHPQFISGLKNQILKAGQANTSRLAHLEEDEDSSSSGGGCQAVVPWIPPRFPSADGDGSGGQTEMVDDEEMGEASMDVEDSGNAKGSGMASLIQGLPQWHHHCTILQPPQNTTTPIVWYP